MPSRFKQLHLTYSGQIESVDLAVNLPTTGIVRGAIRYVEEDSSLYTYDGATWTSINLNGGDAVFDTLTANTLIVNNFSYLNSNVVEIGDNIIVLNSEVTGTPTEDAGVAVNRGSSPSAQIIWDEANDTWTAGIDGNMAPFPGTSPAYKFSRQGAISNGTWLQVDGIPSNQVGHRVGFDSKISYLDIDSSTQGTYEITLYEHDHVVYTPLTTVGISSAYGGQFSLDVPITTGKNIAARMTQGSGADLSVSMILTRV